MPTIQVVAAAAPDHVACKRPDGSFFVRTPYGSDQPIPWDGDPDLMIAALVTKWGMTPVVGPDGKEGPEIDEAHAPILDGEPSTTDDGSEVWKLVDAVPNS